MEYRLVCTATGAGTVDGRGLPAPRVRRRLPGLHGAPRGRRVDRVPGPPAQRRAPHRGVLTCRSSSRAGAWWPERRTWALGASRRRTARSPYPLGIPAKRFGIVCVRPAHRDADGLRRDARRQLGQRAERRAPRPTSSRSRAWTPATGLPDGTNQISHGLRCTRAGRSTRGIAPSRWRRRHLRGHARRPRRLHHGVHGRGHQRPRVLDVRSSSRRTSRGRRGCVAWTVADGWTLFSGSPYMPAGPDALLHGRRA